MVFGLFKFINPFIFLLSFCVGMFFVYTFTSNPDVIYIMPTPDNESSVIYKDKTDTCFKYKSEQVDCPDNRDEINEYKIQ